MGKLFNLDPDRFGSKAEEAEELLKSLANKERLIVVSALVSGEMSIQQLYDVVPLNQACVVQHLDTLSQEGLLSERLDSETAYYSLTNPNLEHIIATLYRIFG